MRIALAALLVAAGPSPTAKSKQARPKAIAEAAAGPSWPAAGLSLGQAQQLWTDGRVVDVAAPQGFRAGLLETELLAELNRQRWSPRQANGSFDAEATKTFWVGPRYVLAFDAAGALRFALVRFSVPVDTAKDGANRWAPGRLHRLKRLLARLQADFRLTPTRRDRHGNVFEWRGTATGARIRVRYAPLIDEVRVLFRFN